MIILTLNCGSSSVKYQLYDWSEKMALARGAVERVAFGGSFIQQSSPGAENIKRDSDCPDHKSAIELILETIKQSGVLPDLGNVKAVGHRVVHGGDRFAKSTIIDDEVMSVFQKFQHLAPLHLPANIMGIEAAQKALPGVPHCAVMDTAWHQTMPEFAFMYALPYEWYSDFHVRRYGFHGTSFLYCAKRAAVLLNRDPFKTNLIICHIGNGSSICAVKNGVSVDTSMGLTPLEGLVMGTRSGDCDPAIAFYVMRQTGKTAQTIENEMNRNSGLLGITGEYADRRDIVDAAARGDKRSLLALELESYRIKKYIGAYAAALGHLDALVFTAGVGEMQPIIREKATSDLKTLGIELDISRNALSKTRNSETVISSDSSKVKILVIPTDEELVMTEDTVALTDGSYDEHTSFTYSFQDRGYSNRERQESFAKELETNPDLKRIEAISAG